MPVRDKDPPRDPEEEAITSAIPGYGASTLVEHVRRLREDRDPHDVLEQTSTSVLRFLEKRDPIAFLARTAIIVIQQTRQNPRELVFEQS